MVFDTADVTCTPIYHTNVMCVATELVLVGRDAITSPARRTEIVDRLHDTGRTVLARTTAC